MTMPIYCSNNEQSTEIQNFNKKIFNTCNDPLLEFFFSEENIKYIKYRTKCEVYKALKEHINTDHDNTSLIILMNGIYTLTKEQITPICYGGNSISLKDKLIKLNQITISDYTKSVISNIKMYKYYINDKNTLPIPLALPKIASVKKGNTLVLQTGFESTRCLNQKIKEYNIFNT